MRGLQKFQIGVLLLLMVGLVGAQSNVSAVVAAPNTQNIFQALMQNPEHKINVLLTNINNPSLRDRFSSSTATSSLSNPSSVQLTPNQVLNNFFNNNLFNQLGIGIKVNF